MKITDAGTIDGRAVGLIQSACGVHIYETSDDNQGLNREAKTYVVDASDRVLFELSVDPFCGEGGGGILEIKDLSNDE